MKAFPRRAGAPAIEPITLAEALTQLKEVSDGGANDLLIEGYIKTAREVCEERTERSMVNTPWVLTLDAFPIAIELMRPPILAVQSVQFYDTEGQLKTLDPNDYLLDRVSEPGYLVPVYGKVWPATQQRINAVIVNYTAGYGTPELVPHPLRQWMKLVVGDLYETRNRSAERPVVPHSFADHLLDLYCMVGV